MIRPLLAVAAALTALAVTPAAAGAQNPSEDQQPPRIAAGVSAGGVDLSELTEAEARDRLREALRPRLRLAVSVFAAGRRFGLPAGRARLRLDASLTARRAYKAGVQAPPAPPAGGGAPVGLDVALALRHSANRVRRFARFVDASVSRPARNATVRITLRRMVRRSSRRGRDLDGAGLYRRLQAVMADPAASRLVRGASRPVRPRLTADDLAAAYPTVLTVDRGGFRLRVFKRLRLSKTYGIAVGAAGFETPRGRYRIQNKTVNPAWSAPNKPWAGLYAGTVVPGGRADNPLKARWLGIANGVGIHGTGSEFSIGSRASHGCIRMRVADVVDLYPRVPVGTPVLIGN